LAAIHRVLVPRRDNGVCNLAAWYEDSVLAEMFPGLGPALDDRRICEMLGGLTSKQVDAIEAAVVQRLIQSEGLSTNALAFDCANFDSYAGARAPSRLLQRGHGKSGKPLRVMGLGLLATNANSRACGGTGTLPARNSSTCSSFSSGSGKACGASSLSRCLSALAR
jgi:hypothetical protein